MACGDASSRRTCCIVCPRVRCPTSSASRSRPGPPKARWWCASGAKPERLFSVSLVDGRHGFPLEIFIGIAFESPGTELGERLNPDWSGATDLPHEEGHRILCARHVCVHARTSLRLVG